MALDFLTNNPITKRLVAIAIGVVVLGFLLGLIDYYGGVAFPEQISNGLHFIISSMYQWDFILPMGALMTTFIIAISMELLFMVVRLVLFIWKILGKSD